MSTPPSPNGSNGGGRSPDGRFAHGNPGGPGNPAGKHWARLRQRVIDLGQECPPGDGEDARERMLANELWSMALGLVESVDDDGERVKTKVSNHDRLCAMDMIIGVYGGRKALQSDDESKDDNAVDPDVLAERVAQQLTSLGLGALLPPGLKRNAGA